MRGNAFLPLVLLVASLAAAGPARAETDPLGDPAVARIRDAFKVDGIALFDPHSQHAPRMGVCAPSIFAGLKWCVSGTAEETKDGATYVKTTGYNIDGENRIVYAISSRRSYPLKRGEFDGIVRAIGERFGARNGGGAAVYAFKKGGEAGEVDSLIAVWGGIRLVHLSEAEYAVVEGGGSLKRGHLVDHRFNLIVSAKQRDPVYKIEGDAGYILHLMVTSPDRADVIARAVYQPVFLPPPAKPGPEANNPLVTDSVRRMAPPARDGRSDDATRSGDARRMEAERALAAERLLREEAERKAAEEKAARAEAERSAREAERKAAEERRALEEAKKRAEAEKKAAEERAAKAEAELKANEERRKKEEAERKSAEERAKRAERERASSEDQRRAEEAERKAAEEHARRAESERKIVEERRRSEDSARVEAERKAAAERRARDE